jgi:hypothetical protein
MGRKGLLIGYWWESQKRTLGRPRQRWVNNIKMDIGWGCVDWINLSQDMNRWRALVNTVMNHQVP